MKPGHITMPETISARLIADRHHICTARADPAMRGELSVRVRRVRRCRYDWQTIFTCSRRFGKHSVVQTY